MPAEAGNGMEYESDFRADIEPKSAQHETRGKVRDIKVSQDGAEIRNRCRRLDPRSWPTKALVGNAGSHRDGGVVELSLGCGGQPETGRPGGLTLPWTQVRSADFVAHEGPHRANSFRSDRGMVTWRPCCRTSTSMMMPDGLSGSSMTPSSPLRGPPDTWTIEPRR